MMFPESAAPPWSVTTQGPQLVIGQTGAPFSSVPLPNPSQGPLSSPRLPCSRLTFWNERLVFRGEHLVPAHCPFSFSDMAHSQFFFVPASSPLNSCATSLSVKLSCSRSIPATSSGFKAIFPSRDESVWFCHAATLHTLVAEFLVC
jgi:hypothetical protein